MVGASWRGWLVLSILSEITVVHDPWPSRRDDKKEVGETNEESEKERKRKEEKVHKMETKRNGRRIMSRKFKRKITGIRKVGGRDEHERKTLVSLPRELDNWTWNSLRAWNRVPDTQAEGAAVGETPAGEGLSDRTTGTMAVNCGELERAWRCRLNVGVAEETIRSKGRESQGC